MGLGGKRPGAGRKKGGHNVATIEKERTLAEVRARIQRKADHLLNAELLEALGSFVVMKADPETLEYRRVTDEDEIIRFIQEHKGANGRMGDSVYILTAKDGNYKSRQYLFDRAFGRPSQSVEIKDTPQISQIAEEVVRKLVDQEGMTHEKALKLAADYYQIPETDVISNANN